MQKSRRFLTSLCVFALAGSACSSSQTPAKSMDTPPPAPAETPPIDPQELGWKDRSEDQKKQYMKQVVLPKMKALFQEHDDQEFATFDCTTCHGEAAKKGEFKMPSAELPKLNPADSFKAHMDDERTVKFMMQKVVPQMAGLLQMEPYNPETQKGFGCFGCHMMDK